MMGVSIIVLLGLVAELGSGQFLNNRPYPTYSLESMPDTDFTCRDKILGGYYADPQTQCQMFHICVKVAGIGVQDFRFLCPNGTAFDQDHQICAEWDDVDCDATTLYYASDNFDLYRLGSGFESKAVKYGEEEETFSLQRAETGDARLNREHQASRVNQQREFNNHAGSSHRRHQNSDRDIFKTSSSSNFFNNRNGGKEVEDDEDDEDVGANANQQRDNYQKRKLIRKQQRRPNEQQAQPQQPAQPARPQPPTHQYRVQQQQQTQSPTVQSQTTPRIQRPTGFVNNFAGSFPTTANPSPSPNNNNANLNQNQYSTAITNFRQRNGQRRPVNRQYNDADNFRQTTPLAIVSTPAPFRQTQAKQAQPLTNGPKISPTENYPPNFNKQQYTNKQIIKQQPQPQPQPPQPTGTQALKPTTGFDTHYDVPKIKVVAKPNPPPKDNYPSTPQLTSTKAKQAKENFLPTTFAPKTQFYTTNLNQKQTTQALQQFNNQFQAPNTPKQKAQPFQANNPPTIPPAKEQFSAPASTPQAFNPANHFSRPFANQFSNQLNQNQEASTPKTTPYTQYTPTVPKVSSTTPVVRSNRFDETQYDDGSYNPKYDEYDDRPSYKDDEFLKTAHSQNIASSRNEFVKNAAKKAATQTQPPPPPPPSQNAQKSYQSESPRPFAASANPKATENYPNYPKTTKLVATPKPVTEKKLQPPKQTQQAVKSSGATNEKNASYDYAYYDSNVGSDPEYDIDTDFKKTTG